MATQYTCGIFLVDDWGRFLIVHPTGARSNDWSIPKGKAEPGEDYFEAAKRELMEETDLDINQYGSNLVGHWRLQEVRYRTQNKILVPFVIFLDIDLDNVPLSCPHLVDGRNYPENDDFQWVGFERGMDMIHPTQQSALQELVSRERLHGF